MDPTEIELKFTVPPGARESVERHPRFADVTPSRKRLISTYFDTPNCALRRRGFSLRVRQGPHGWVQTLKGPGSFGPRSEWEWPLRGDEPEFSRLAEARLDKSLISTVAKRSRPLFVTDIDRTERMVQIRGSGAVAAAIDEGAIRAGNRSIDVHELELEVKHGSILAAFQLARDLVASAPLRINPCSKADRGYGLVIDKVSAVKSEAPGLPRGITVADAIPKLVGASLSQFVGNIPAADAGQVEGVHQMRVALRRLRTLFVLFAPELEAATRTRLSDAIRSLGTPLGDARDWDVFVTETLKEAEQADVRREWIASLRAAADIRRQAAHQGVRDLIAGAKPTELVLATGEWVEGTDWAGRDRRPSTRKLKSAVPRLLGRIERKVCKRGQKMPDLEGAAMHALRKAVKKLRYSVDYATPIYGKRRTAKFAKACKKLQSQLGTINDGVVTNKLVDTLAPRDEPVWAPVAGALLAWNQERTERARRKATRAWPRFERRRPFWA
jgi:triphosphatase